MATLNVKLLPPTFSTQIELVDMGAGVPEGSRQPHLSGRRVGWLGERSDNCEDIRRQLRAGIVGLAILLLISPPVCVWFLTETREIRSSDLAPDMDDMYFSNRSLVAQMAHLSLHDAYFPQAIPFLLMTRASLGVLDDDAPTEWTRLGPSLWTITRRDMLAKYVTMFTIALEAIFFAKPGYDWTYGTLERLTWALIAATVMLVTRLTYTNMTVFGRVLDFFEQANDELDAALEESGDSLEPLKERRAQVLADMTMLLGRVQTMFNCGMISVWGFFGSSVFALFADRTNIVNFLAFLWFGFCVSFVLWNLSDVNHRSYVFLQRLHTLEAPSIHALNDAEEFFAKRPLQIKVLGVPITRTLFSRYLASLSVPLVASSTSTILNFVDAGYF